MCKLCSIQALASSCSPALCQRSATNCSSSLLYARLESKSRTSLTAQQKAILKTYQSWEINARACLKTLNLTLPSVVLNLMLLVSTSQGLNIRKLLLFQPSNHCRRSRKNHCEKWSLMLWPFQYKNRPGSIQA